MTAEKNVSIDNLPLLQGIGQLMATYDGKTLGVNPEIQDLIEEKGHLNMMKNAIYLITRGGLTEDFLQVYDRHQKVFNYYGIKGNVLYTGNSEEIKIPFDYNLSIAFGVFDKENPKVLDAIYEASQRQLFEWSDEYNSNVIYPYLNYKSEYFKHLKKYYPKSKFYKEFDFELTAEQLYRAYEENEVAADQKYKGKKIAVSGRIAGIQKDIIGDTYVLLETNYYVNRIQCYFNDETVISNLRKGQDFTLIGTNYGMTLTNVILKDCQAY
ncbi:MAG: OB-fold protein [Cytophagaceae bacterium]